MCTMLGEDNCELLEHNDGLSKNNSRCFWLPPGTHISCVRYNTLHKMTLNMHTNSSPPLLDAYFFFIFLVCYLFYKSISYVPFCVSNDLFQGEKPATMPSSKHTQSNDLLNAYCTSGLNAVHN